MIWLSALLVFGTAGVIVSNLAAQEGQLLPGFQQLIHARIPWLLLGLLWTGAALGLVSLVRTWRRSKLALVVLEFALVGLASWYFLSGSFLPPHRLAVDVGDPFPAWELVDQDGRHREFRQAKGPGPSLYIFYRGDW